MEKYFKDFLKGGIGILAMITIVFTLPEFIKVLNGQCLTESLEIWSYRINILAWFVCGALLFEDNIPGKKKKKKKVNR